ncbi:hypothetical protein [Streptomyces luteireticuli]|uniref:Uncharacterized protein n=1 Tax=Streptomyces luteireticuli TaxID=173858 RepID=A0ABN0Z8Y4_9ACTN
MSAQPVEQPYDPYRLEAAQGPQTLAALRAALADVAPADLLRFDAKLAAVQLDQVEDVISEYRHVWALRSRPEVLAALADSLNGRTDLVAYPLTEDSAA